MVYIQWSKRLLFRARFFLSFRNHID
ncbi:hypothetical protein JTF06_11555 [Desemzia sp. RIT804]|nr:hypothetical protein [Desemzia sp. RIT 804]